MTKSKLTYSQIFFLITVLWGALIMALTGCNRKASDDEDYESAVSAITPDTVVAIETETIPDTIPAMPKSESIEDLMDFMSESEDARKYAEGIIPAIVTESPEYAYKLLCNNYDRFIVVDKSRMKVVLFDKFGRMEKTYGMACAKNYGTKHKKGDSRTPEGFFSVEGTYDSTEWLFTDDNGVTSKKKGQFGPRFIRIRIPNTSQIGIHGTCAPWSIGSRASHGCIRIKNENILELVELVEPGMPVIIVPGRKDMEQNKKEGADIAWIPTAVTSKRPDIKEEKTETEDIPADTVSIANADSVASNPVSPIHEPDSVNGLIIPQTED